MRTEKMKKTMAGILASSLVLAAALPAAAAGNDTMTVGYTEQSEFTLSIPSSVKLQENAGVSETVGLSKINVGTREKVQIKVKNGIADGKVTLSDVKDVTNTARSTVSLTEGGAGIADNAVVAEFEGTDTTATKDGTLYFSALGNVPAGTYSGTLVFEAQITAKS